MKIPLGTSNPQHPLRKGIAAIILAFGAVSLAIASAQIPGARIAMSLLDTTLYDAFYRLRAPEDRTNKPIVIVAVDEKSIRLLNEKYHLEWPWQRDVWARVVTYLSHDCQARAIAFDLEFQDTRNFDKEFSAALDKSDVPIIYATAAQPDGKPDKFALKLQSPKFGAVNILASQVARKYPMDVNGMPTLAVKTAEAASGKVAPPPANPFYLRYFGPYERIENNQPKHTYTYISAANLCVAATIPDKVAASGISPDMFRGKIVLIGATATGTFDLKSSPVSDIYPGVEIHATAIDDLLTGQFVEPVRISTGVFGSLAAAMLAAVGIIFPRRAWLKILLAAIATALLAAGALLIFLGHTIHWLPMAVPIVSLLLAIVGSFAWSYITEDRQRRFVLKALSQYVSPDVAAEISRNPDSLKLGGQRREMTVLFSDIQGFTDLSESMPSEKLSAMLNYYLGEMSGLILKNDGTLDKYIGDAIMSFWNAPVLQADHAALACYAALAMQRREAEIQPDLETHGAKGLLTRIGINTGPMVVGNMGSAQKFNYSVLGDSVNLASRLEGANKFYGSRILVSEFTAALVNQQFALRKLDVLRVKGKQQPLAIYELLAAGKATGDLLERIEKYEKAFTYYQARQWDQAEEFLADLHARYLDDKPAAALRKRIAALRHDPPGADWDGVYVAKDK